jgi:site-specific recombinase XerD
MNLSNDNLCIGINNKPWIYAYRQKTSIPIKIPLLSKASDIIEKYKERPNSMHKEKLFPTISNQKLNSYLKEIADVCGIKKNLTFHIARHTFATTVTLSNGVPIETVSKLLGHSKITTTQIYAKVIERKVSDDMQKLHEVFENQKSKVMESEHLKQV